MSPRLHRFRLASEHHGPIRLIDAQRCSERVTLWIGNCDRPITAALEGKATPLPLEVLPGGFQADVEENAGPVLLAGRSFSAAATPTEHDLLDGRNVLLGLRYSETAEDVVRWVDYHFKHHGADAALVFDLGQRSERRKFADKLGRALEDDASGPPILLVSSDAPLGHRDLPEAKHPFNAPAAPGKARMTNVLPDPWHSPLGETLLFEVLHRRFLEKARAVLCIDVSDLLLADGDTGNSVFDRTQTVDGYLRLTGREVYPWRIAKGQRAVHADHTCVQFDRAARRRRWAIAPAKVGDGIWRITRIAGLEATDDPAEFVRCMSLRHPGSPVSSLVPKTGLVEDGDLVSLAQDIFGYTPSRPPEAKIARDTNRNGHVTVVTCMKNEGPFILEWLAFHRSIGIERYLVYSNDCDDGTDRLLDVLQKRGLVQHRDNPYRRMGQRPQHAAFSAAEAEPLLKQADWIVAIDVDEFINIHVGAGRMADLFAAVPDANMISMTWRLFGNADRHSFEDIPVTEQFLSCANQLVRKPHQAWGFKTLFRRNGIFRKLGVHRPKGLVPQLKDHIQWVNGSGKPMPETAYRNAWRSTMATYGYDLVTLNHYAVRNAESFLVKRDRGRVNHVERDQGLLYWFRMNNNSTSDLSIQAKLPGMHAELDRLLSDPEIRAAHVSCVEAHKTKIASLRSRADYDMLYGELSSPRLEKMSRLHAHFGSGVFWSGPQVVPDEIVEKDPSSKFFFTVDPVGKGH